MVGLVVLGKAPPSSVLGAKEIARLKLKSVKDGLQRASGETIHQPCIVSTRDTQNSLGDPHAPDSAIQLRPARRTP